MFGIGMQELLILALIILLFFGGKKIPEMMKGLGKGVKSFKDGMSGLDDENSKDAANSDKRDTAVNKMDTVGDNAK